MLVLYSNVLNNPFRLLGWKGQVSTVRHYLAADEETDSKGQHCDV